MRERTFYRLALAADVMGWLLIALVVGFWVFEIGRAIARGVLP